MTRVFVVAGAVLLSACASAGTSSPSQATSVPVYEGADAVPCQFEVMRRVRGEATVAFTASRDAQTRERDRILGSEGARLRADAVLVPDPARVTGRAVVAIPANQVPSTRTIEFEGDAIRFLPGTCRDGR